MPGWRKLWEVYLRKCGSRSPKFRPLLMALIITDGDADDSQHLANTLRGLSERVYVTLAIIGMYERGRERREKQSKPREIHSDETCLLFGQVTVMSTRQL